MLHTTEFHLDTLCSIEQTSGLASILLYSQNYSEWHLALNSKIWSFTKVYRGIVSKAKEIVNTLMA